MGAPRLERGAGAGRARQAKLGGLSGPFGASSVPFKGLLGITHRPETKNILFEKHTHQTLLFESKNWMHRVNGITPILEISPVAQLVAEQ